MTLVLLSLSCLSLALYFVSISLFFSGFVIVGENNTGKLDLGIFIASIVPDGPADRDGRIRPGTEQGAKTSQTRLLIK
jgi:hypothetical protein